MWLKKILPNFIKRVTAIFIAELPSLASLDDYLDYILTKIKLFNYGMKYEADYQQVRWLEVREEASFHERILHILKSEAVYVRSVDGDATEGTWDYNPATQILTLKINNVHELYEPVFLNSAFFILKKHGNEAKRKTKYWLLGVESVIQRLSPREVVERLFYVYQYNIFFIGALIGFGALFILILYYSY